MPADRITIDDAFDVQAETAAAPKRGITFDEAFADYESAKVPARVGVPEAYTGPRVSDASRARSPAPGTQLVSPQGQGIQPASSANFGPALESQLVEDEGTQLGILAKRLFPNDPEGVKRLGLVDGKPVYVNDKGKLEYVSGALTRAGAGVVANAPEIAGGVVGSFAGNPVAGAALGSAAGKGYKQIAANLLYDEPQTPGGNAAAIALEGGINAATAGAGKLVARAKNNGRIVDFAPTEIKTAEQARDYIKRTTGIDLDLAQASGSRKLLALRDFAARYPGKTADMIQAQEEIQSGQFDAAVNRVLDMVAKSQPSETAGKAGVNAAQATIAGARQGVYQQTRPLYQAAYDAVPVIDDATPEGKQLLGYLKLPYFSQAFAKAKKLRTLEAGPGVPDDPAKPLGLAEFDYTKQALDDQIDSLATKGRRKEAALLKRQRDSFVEQLDAFPNSQYQTARQTYAQLIQQNVEPLEKGVVGILAKVDDQNLSTAAARILGDYGVTKEQAALTRSILSQKYPDEYRGLVRNYLAQAYDQAQKITQGGDALNVPGKFRQALFGTPNGAEKTRNLLPPDVVKALDDLMLASEKLAQTPLGASRVAGSNTVRDQNITEALKSRGVSIAKFVSAPLRTISGNAAQSAERRAQEEGIESLTEALLDPAKRNQLKQILRIKDSTKQTILLGALFSGQGSKIAAEQTIGETRTPPGYRPPGQ